DFLEQAASGYEARDGQARWLERVSAEYPNVRVALDWCIARENAELVARLSASAWDFWTLHGHYAEGARTLERAVHVVPDNDAARRAPILAGLGAMCGALGDTERAIAASREAIDLFRSLGDVRGEALNSYGLALSLVEAGDHRADEWVTEAETL